MIREEPLSRVCHAAVKAAPSGISAAAVADILGKNYTTFMNELVHNGTHKPDMDLLIPIVKATGSDAPLKAIGRACGCVFLPLPEVAGDDCPLTAGMAQSVTQFGELLAALGDAIRDGVISENEARRINKEGHEVLEAVLQVLKITEQMAGG